MFIFYTFCAFYLVFMQVSGRKKKLRHKKRSESIFYFMNKDSVDALAVASVVAIALCQGLTKREILKLRTIIGLICQNLSVLASEF